MRNERELVRERVANVEHAAKELRERLEACRGRNAEYLRRLRHALEVHDLEHLPGDSREGCALCKALQGL
jgi:hypothetical protein